METLIETIDSLINKYKDGLINDIDTIENIVSQIDTHIDKKIDDMEDKKVKLIEKRKKMTAQINIEIDNINDYISSLNGVLGLYEH